MGVPKAFVQLVGVRAVLQQRVVRVIKFGFLEGRRRSPLLIYGRNGWCDKG